MTRTPLTMVRLPGPHGPTVRCQGDLTVATMEALRRDLALLTAAGHEGLLVDVTGVRHMDADAVLALVEAARAMKERGGRLVLVAGRDPSAAYLRLLGVERVVSLARSEQEAQVLLDGSAEEPEASWERARASSLARWDHTLAKIGHAAPEEMVRDLTSMFALCRRAEDVYRQSPAPDLLRCHFCPLFYALGGRREDLGCGSVLDRLIEHVRQRDWARLRAGIRDIMAEIERMPLPA